MKHVFTLLAFALMSSGLAQLPEYVPSDGLVAWYPLDGFAYDAGTYELDGALEGPAVAEDRYGNPHGALSFDGDDDRVSIPHSELTNPSVLTLSVWFKDSDFSNSDGQQSQLISKREFTGWGNAYEFGIGYPINAFPETPTIYSNFSVDGNQTIFHASDSIVENQWHQAVYCHGDDSLFIYLDGERVLAQISPGPLPTNNELPTWFGGRPGDNGRNFYSGLLDDIGIWNRVLSDEEVLALYLSEQPISGCTDTEACNYEPTATEDDGSCLDCMLFADHCGEGTVWDDESQTCVVANPSDTDFDGCVGMTDLLNLLSVFGTCVEVPWACGDLLEYQGYDYETVQIGEQCWFAENTRILPSVSPASEYSLSQPISYVYGYNGNSVEEAKMTSNYSTFGVLYNFQAIQQWDLCPSGWHVPSDEDWMELEYSLGIQQDSLSVVGYRGHLVGASMKSQDLWNGNNQSGLEMLAGGGTVDSGEFVFEGERGWYWTSTEAPAQAAWFRQLETNQSAVYRAHWNQNQQSGHSVRCIQDSE